MLVYKRELNKKSLISVFGFTDSPWSLCVGGKMNGVMNNWLVLDGS